MRLQNSEAQSDVKMESKRGLFIIKFMHLNQQLQVVPSMEKSHEGVVIGKDGLSFTINVACKNGEVVYGSKLFIDGQEIFKSKTFKKTGNFFGFRTEEVGKFEEFLFRIPEFQRHQMIEAAKTSMEQKERGSKMGEIKIVFFESQEKWVSEQKPRGGFKAGPAFVPVSTSDSKSVGARSLSVTTGKKFSLAGDRDRFKGKENRYDEKSRMMKIDQPDFDKVIDQIVIRYSSVAAMLGLSLLSPFNPLKLQYFPREVLEENEFLNTVVLQEVLLGAPDMRLPAEHLGEAYLHSVKRPFTDVMKRSVEEFCGKSAVFGVESRKGSKVVFIRNPDAVLTKEHLMKKVMDGEFHRFCAYERSKEETREPENYLGKRRQSGEAQRGSEDRGRSKEHRHRRYAK